MMHLTLSLSYRILFYCVFAIFSWSTIIESKITEHAYTKQVIIPIEVPAQELIHKDLLTISVDHPQIHINQWHTSIEPITKYDPITKENKKMFDRSFDIEATITSEQIYDDACIHVSYFQQNTRTTHEKIIPIIWLNQEKDAPDTTSAINTENIIVTQQTDIEDVHTNKNFADHDSSFSCYVQHLVQRTENIWIRLLLVLLLGLLMSLTPCIYPMIPITVGILQSQGSTSMLRHFLLSLCYTTGIATMFALLGLLAASTGQMFGAIMANPFVILAIVALLLYLAGSMLGLYNMYTPKFLSNGSTASVKKGSYISVFLFGFISGSIASPCLSPGLILLLTIVTTLQNKLLGFALLFCFGIGLSIPLLLVGTFSSALNTLPRAGMWMVEVKKFFGVLLIGMCFYFLHMIVSWYILISLMTVTTSTVGIWYLSQPTYSKGTQRFNSIIGIICIASSLILALESYKAYITKDECPITNTFWITDYKCAQEKAIHEKKPLLIKVEGPCCSLCTAIDNKQFADAQVIEALKDSFICVKIDISQENNSLNNLKKEYQILGVPTILVINPTTSLLLKKWQGELYHIAPPLFATTLYDIAQYHTT